MKEYCKIVIVKELEKGEDEKPFIDSVAKVALKEGKNVRVYNTLYNSEDGEEPLFPGTN